LPLLVCIILPQIILPFPPGQEHAARDGIRQKNGGQKDKNSTNLNHVFVVNLFVFRQRFCSFGFRILNLFRISSFGFLTVQERQKLAENSRSNYHEILSGCARCRLNNRVDEKGDLMSAGSPSAGAVAQQPALDLMTSRQFKAWMAEQQISLAFTTYQTGKLFLIGLQPNGRLSIFERTFNRCMGLWAAGQTLWMTSLFQLWRFENVLQPGQLHDDYDRLYVPQVGYTTGDIDIHDTVVDARGRVVFVNSLFSCLATTSETHSFASLWKPPFITKLAAEDRCHLNGLAMKDGRPKYVTAASQTDVTDGWRDRRHDGGCVIDVETNEIVCDGLSMPHSPRLYGEQLWLLDSGTGYLGTVDIGRGSFEPVTFCPGYARGLAIHNDFAMVGLSKCRHNRTFTGLALDDNLAARDAEARCGLHVVDLKTGDAVHWVRMEGIVEELYDVVVLPGVRRPMALGFKTDEIRRTLLVGDEQPLIGKSEIRSTKSETNSNLK